MNTAEEQKLRIIAEQSASTGDSPAIGPRRVRVQRRVWSTLTHLAERTYVPDTERSHALGAGADLDDNE